MIPPPASAACASSCGSGTRPSPARGHTGETPAAQGPRRVTGSVGAVGRVDPRVCLDPAGSGRTADSPSFAGQSDQLPVCRLQNTKTIISAVFAKEVTMATGVRADSHADFTSLPDLPQHVPAAHVTPRMCWAPPRGLR